MPVMASVVTGVMRACKELDVRAILDEMPDPAVPSQIIQRREVDAAIVFFMSGLNTQHLSELKERIPLVWVMGSEDVQAEVDHVTIDNCGAGQQAYRYLAQRGCTRFAFISDHPDWPFTRLRARKRSRTLRTTMARTYGTIWLAATALRDMGTEAISASAQRSRNWCRQWPNPHRDRTACSCRPTCC